MAAITITVPDEHLSRVRRALTKDAGLENTAQNAKKAVIDHIKAVVRRVETAEAQEAALAAIEETNADDVAS
jgi:hypothetical protein